MQHFFRRVGFGGRREAREELLALVLFQERDDAQNPLLLGLGPRHGLEISDARFDEIFEEEFEGDWEEIESRGDGID